MALTADTFEQAVTGDGIVLWISGPAGAARAGASRRSSSRPASGALPAAALEQVITAVQGLDMDDVHTKIAAKTAAAKR